MFLFRTLLKLVGFDEVGAMSVWWWYRRGESDVKGMADDLSHVIRYTGN